VATHSLDDLRRVIRRIETRRPKRPAAQPIEEVLGGELVDTGAGPLLVVRREFPLSHRHGRQRLGLALLVEKAIRVGGEFDAAALRAEKICAAAEGFGGVARMRVDRHPANRVGGHVNVLGCFLAHGLG